MKTQGIHCILNNRDLTRYDHIGTTVLDFVRLTQKLTGTKEGCREGDCGACTILVGTLKGGAVQYRAVNSCLLPLGDVNGSHIVTIEGLRQSGSMTQQMLTPVQSVMAECGGTQCGFCTPGFIMSMTGYLLSTLHPDEKSMLAALDGNVCRCTGYMSIKRAIQSLLQTLTDNTIKDSTPVERCVQAKIVPTYFSEIPRRLSTLFIQDELLTTPSLPGAKNGGTLAGRTIFIAGGTDVFVQQGETLAHIPVVLLNTIRPEAEIRFENGMCIMDAHTTIAEVYKSKLLHEYYPTIRRALQYFASSPIRERATVAGNIANASPIGDMAILLLALNAEIVLSNAAGVQRTIALRDFYKGYKTLNKKPDELISTIQFVLPNSDGTTMVSMEKVSRRTYLDIASVNSALKVVVYNNTIVEVHASAGGVAPIPLYLSQTVAYLLQKPVTAETFRVARQLSMEEAQPISDARGSASYKRQLLGHFMLAHAHTLFPHLNFQEDGA